MPQDRHVSRRGSVAGALVVAATVALLVAPLFALCAKALYAGILSAEARTVLEASATCAFPCLSLARLEGGIGEEEMAAFRAALEEEVRANAAGGPLEDCIAGVEAELAGPGTVACVFRYRPGRLGEGLFGDLVPDPSLVTCRVDLPVEP